MQLTTLNDFLVWAESSFLAQNLVFGHGTNNAWDEAVALALSVLKLPPTVDASVGERVLSLEEKKVLLHLMNRRIQEQIPVPYLTHEAWFANLSFYVDERVIIPRSPFAELILNGFQPWLGQRPVRHILDLCTGSGCIAIACAKVFPDATIHAVDISKDALDVARQNVQLHQCEEQVQLIQSDLFSGCGETRYDIIISNPPYVDSQEIAILPPEYRWEPQLALVAGKDGLSIVHQILQQAPKHLTETGLLFVEVGNSMEALLMEYPQFPFTWLEFERGGEGVFMLEAGDTQWQQS